jgi:hypothetical protein
MGEGMGLGKPIGTLSLLSVGVESLFLLRNIFFLKRYLWDDVKLSD